MSFALSRVASFSRARVWSRLGPLSKQVFRRNVQEFPPTSVDNSVPQDHFIVLAENLDQTDNELLRLPKVGEREIDFSKIDVETAFKGLSRAICSFEDYLTDIESAEQSPYKLLEELFKDIEKNLYPLDSAYNLLMAKMSTAGGDFSRKEINLLLQRYYEVRDKRYTGVIEKYFKELVQKVDYNKIDQNDKKLIDFYRTNINCPKSSRPLDESTMFELKRNLKTDETQFMQCVHWANSLIKHTVDDPDILSAVASEYAECESLHHKERTPMKVTAATYQKFMNVCPDSFVRRMLWETYNKRASPKALPRLNTHPYQTTIRVNRRKIAEMSGFRSHLEFKLRNTMAKTKQNVMASLESIKEDNEPKMRDRLEELNDYASDNQQPGIQEQDIDYWSHRYTHDVLIGMNRHRLTSFFPLRRVTQGIKQFYEDFMSMEITVNDNKQIKSGLCSSEGQLWQVKINGDLMGSIIFDPFQQGARPNSSHLYARIRTKFSNPYETTHTRLISTPYTVDPSTKEPHLSVKDVMTLFHCFSVVIQRLLYNYKYYELNTLGALEYDTMNLFPHLCRAHLLKNHKILQSMSARDSQSHSKPIDSELASRILRSFYYFRPLKIWNELYRAHLDLEIHSVMTNTKNLAEEIYSIYSPFERFPDNYDYCAMSDIFVGPDDGTKYADSWARQLAVACLAQIEDSSGNLDDNKMRDFYNKLIPALFDANNLETETKLVSLFAGSHSSFEPTKSGLGVL